MTQGSTILLNIFFGPIINAAFNIGNQVFNALSTLSNSIIFAFRPAMIKAYSGDNHNYLEKLFSINNRILLNLLICITVPLLLETKSILSLWLGDITEDMVIFTQLYIIYEIIFTIHNPITIIIQATGKVRLYSIIVESLTILCLPISWVLFKMGFSATYLFYTMIGICFIAHIARLIVLKSIYQEFNLSNYALKDFLPAVLTFSVTYACISSFHLHIHNVILRLPIVCITSIMLTMLLAYFINSSHEERQFINKYIIRQR
jgi:polysaccharide biosynthesis protein domain protein